MIWASSNGHRCRPRPSTVALSLALTLAACASGPPVPDWQRQGPAALDRAVAAYLGGDGRIAQAEFDRAWLELSRSGRTDLLARAALLRCAAQVASLARIRVHPRIVGPAWLRAR